MLEGLRKSFREGEIRRRSQREEQGEGGEREVYRPQMARVYIASILRIRGKNEPRVMRHFRVFTRRLLMATFHRPIRDGQSQNSLRFLRKSLANRIIASGSIEIVQALILIRIRHSDSTKVLPELSQSFAGLNPSSTDEV